MQRVSNERGAVGVVVAMLMVPVMGLAAISIDAAALWSQKLQSQTGADAGALAIAHDCAISLCGNPFDTAQRMATENMTSSDTATATVTVTLRLAFATRLFGTGVTLTGRGVMRCNG